MPSFYLQAYAIILFSTTFLIMVSLMKEERYDEITGMGLNVIIWGPFVAKSLGWI